MLVVALFLAAVVGTVRGEQPACDVVTAYDAAYAWRWVRLVASARAATVPVSWARVRWTAVVPAADGLFAAVEAAACAAVARATAWWYNVEVRVRSLSAERSRQLAAAYTCIGTDSRTPHLSVRARHPELAGAKLYFAELIDADVRRAVVLDADTELVGAGGELLLCAVGARRLGAVPMTAHAPGDAEWQPAVPHAPGVPGDWCDGHRSPATEPWMNSGVLVVNATWWRDEAMQARVDAYVAAQPTALRLDMFDQSVLNLLVEPRLRTQLPVRWNWTADAVPRTCARLCVLHAAGRGKWQVP